MKGLWLAGLILLLNPIHQTVVDVSQVEVPPVAKEAWQHIEELAQQVDQEWTSLVDLVASGQATPEEINRQMDQLAQDISQLNQALIDQGLARQMGIRHLPPQRATGTPQSVSGIEIVPGDSRVSGNAVRTAAKIISDVSLPILQNQLGEQPQKAQIVLFSSRQSYADALLQAGVSSHMIPQMVAHTGGVTVGNDIWIPLYAVQDESDLANVLTHELTHVVLNEMGIGDQLPVWINEGTAWYNGRLAQGQLDPQRVTAQDEAMLQQLHRVARRGGLLPLSAGEQQIIQAPYNVEWQDYLAVRQLIKDGGLETFQAFLRDAAREGPDQSFQDHYQTDLQTYEDSLESTLASALAN